VRLLRIYFLPPIGLWHQDHASISYPPLVSGTRTTVTTSWTGAAPPQRHRVLMEPRSIAPRGASSHAPIKTAEPVQRSR
jgi:hypothetical protein